MDVSPGTEDIYGVGIACHAGTDDSYGEGNECRPDTDDIYGERNECHPGTHLTILTTSIPQHLTPALPHDNRALPDDHDADDDDGESDEFGEPPQPWVNLSCTLRGTPYHRG